MSLDEPGMNEPEEENLVEEISSGPPIIDRLPPLLAYQAALAKYPHAVAVSVAAAIGLTDIRRRKLGLAESIAEGLSAPRAAERLVHGLDHSARTALGVFGLAEATSWSTQGLRFILACLDINSRDAIVPLLTNGLVALEVPDAVDLSTWHPHQPLENWPNTTLRLCPSVLSVCRTTLPFGEGPKSVEEVRQVREADGLEPILRLAVLWQRVSEAPLRQTQSGQLYKRDRDRIEEDAALVGPIADAIDPLPDPATFWLALARGVGLMESEAGTERIMAAPASYWDDNAYHLPQMVASRWLTITHWQEQAGTQASEIQAELTLPHLRAVTLLWLAKLEPDQWCGLDDLAAHFDNFSFAVF